MKENNNSDPRWAAAGLGLTLGVVAGILTAGVDGMQSMMKTQTSLTAFEGIQMIVSLGALYGLVGVVIGVFSGFVIMGLNDAFGRGFFKRLYGQLLRERKKDERWAAGVLAFLFSMLFSGLLIYTTHRYVSSGFNNQGLAALFLGGVGGAVTGLTALFFFPLFCFFRFPSRFIPSVFGVPRTFVVLFVGGLAGVMAALLLIFSTDWRIINFSPYIGLGLLFTVLVLMVVIMNRYGNRMKSYLSGVVSSLVSVGLIAATWSCAAWVFDDRQNLIQIVEDDTWNGSFMLRIGRAFSDRDGDGYARWFGGGDCNDDDPTINPGAHDIPGDGIDQNCSGVDAVVPPPPVKVERENLEDQDPLKSFKFEGNFLFIIVDTLRADRLGIANYKRDLTPNIDELVKESVFFRETYAQGNRTPHSFGSFLTSRYPSQVDWKNKRASYSPLLDSNLMVFEVLKDAGYRNLAELRHFYFHPKRNFQQGFAPGDWVNKPEKSIKETNTDISSPDITRRAIVRLEELKGSDKPFALWVHYGDPHSRYMKHEEYPITERGRAGLIQKYDYEIKFTDKHVGMLLKKLKDLGMEEDTAVVLFSDHGEAFGRHRFKGKRMYFHGQTLYNDLVRVPMLFRVPGVKPRVVKDRAMLLDMASTVVDMIRSPIPDSFKGSSLVPYFFGKKLPARDIRAELPPYKAWPHEMVMMIRGKWKLIYRISDNIFELYDLEKDPNEMKNVASKHPDIVRTMRADIRNY